MDLVSSLQVLPFSEVIDWNTIAVVTEVHQVSASLCVVDARGNNVQQQWQHRHDVSSPFSMQGLATIAVLLKKEASVATNGKARHIALVADWDAAGCHPQL